MFSLCLHLFSWRFPAQFHINLGYSHVYNIASLDIIMTRILSHASEIKPYFGLLYRVSYGGFCLVCHLASSFHQGNSCSNLLFLCCKVWLIGKAEG